MPDLSRFADRIGLAGLYLFAFSAWISKKPATAGLILVALACLLDARRFWQSAHRAPLFWVTVLMAAYISLSAVTASLIHPDWASYHWEDATALVYLCAFILIGWWFAGSEKRILVALGLTLAGFLIGRLEHFDWTFSSAIPWWQQRQQLGFASPIAFGQYVALAAIGLVVLAPRFWRLIRNHWWRWPALLVWLLLSVLAFQGIFSAASKSAWIALVVLIPTLVVLNGKYLLDRKRGQTIIFGMLVLTIASTLLYLNWNTVKNYTFAESHVYKQLLEGDFGDISADAMQKNWGDVGSVGIRVHMWRFGVEQWRDSIFFGHGPGASRPLIELKGDASFNQFHDLHSGYVEIPLRLGVTGLALYALGLWLLVAGAWWAYTDGRLSRDLFIVLGSAVALHLLVNTTNFRMLNTDWRFYWLLFAGALASFAFEPVHTPPGRRLPR